MDDWKMWTAIGAFVVTIIRVWQEYLSARVRLRSDLSLMKEAKEAGVDVSLIQVEVEKRIQLLYGQPDENGAEANDAAVEEPEASWFILIIMFGISLVVLGVSLQALIDGVQGWLNESDLFGVEDIVFGLFFGAIGLLGTVICSHDIYRKLFAKKSGSKSET